MDILLALALLIVGFTGGFFYCIARISKEFGDIEEPFKED